MKKIIPTFGLCFWFASCLAQAGEWTWVHGNNTGGGSATYGVQGVPSPANNPGALYEPCEWKDLNGNFWLFGGNDFSGDLWKYNPLTNEWTWMKGPGFAGYWGNWGTQGVPSPTNNPPGRAFGATSWTDNQGNLWLFGGNHTGFIPPMSDLWKYNISTNEWTWMKGPNITGQTGVYGTQGVADPANRPGCRSECAAAWTDNSGNLWLFGGFNGPSLMYNDLWKYNVASNQWTWMKGSQTYSLISIYGTLGVENAANTPGGRYAYCHWKDNSGKLWLFGGGSPGTINNELWRYNISTNNWAWMGGDNSVGIYGTKCVLTSYNLPRRRFENRTSWTDQAGDFWFFGGASGSGPLWPWNDLWKYCVTIGQWVWISGDSIQNPTGHWGTIGITDPANKPNGRGGAVGWSDDNGHFYIFGGSGTGGSFYNDLWKYNVDTTCGVCPNTTSIEETNFTNDLLVFPNPINSSFTISFPSSEKQTVELRIYNTLGELNLFLPINIGMEKVFKKEINVEKWSEGIYFLQVKMKEGVVSKKVMVQH
jgi:hypothetical protein